MAINLEDTYPTKVNPASPAYPFGQPRNITTPGDGTGTPWEQALIRDLVAWQQRALQDAGLTPSGTPDTAEVSQITQALLKRHGRVVDTIADMKELTGISQGAEIFTGGYNYVGDGGGSRYLVDPADITTPSDGGFVHVGVDGTRYKLVHKGVTTLKQWGCYLDGSTDDYARASAALASGTVIEHDGGVLATSGELQWTEGSFLIGRSNFFWQDPSNFPSIDAACQIKYIGAGGANSTVCRMSRVAVGTKPTYQPDESETLRNAGIYGVLIDGNNLAEFGLYSARAGLGNLYDQIIVTGCKEHGGWFGEFWTCKVGSILAIWNYGRGLTVGYDTFGWGGTAVNGTDWGLVQCYQNGRDLATWGEADYLEGYGLGWFARRSNTIANLIVEENLGVGAVFGPDSGPNTVSSIYCEDNCKIAASTSHRYQFWLQSTASAVMLRINGCYVLYNGASGLTNAPRIKLAGTPVANAAEVPVFARVFGGAVFDAEFGEYRIEETPLIGTSRIVSHYPQYSDADTISSSQTTLYIDDAVSGTGSGIDAGNAMASFDAALRVAKVVSSITTIEMSAVTGTPAAARTIDGAGIDRRLTIVGGGTGRFNAVSGTAATFKNWRSELLVSGLAVVERCYLQDTNVRFHDCPVMRMDTGSSAGAAVNLDRARAEFSGTTVISVGGSAAAVKQGILLKGNSQASFSNAAAGTITGHTTDDAITFDRGGGLVRLNNTTAAATWGTSVTYSTGGEGGMVQATNGIKVGTVAGAFL